MYVYIKQHEINIKNQENPHYFILEEDWVELKLNDPGREESTNKGIN